MEANRRRFDLLLHADLAELAARNAELRAEMFALARRT
jgi:hypothetical protein